MHAPQLDMLACPPLPPHLMRTSKQPYDKPSPPNHSPCTFPRPGGDDVKVGLLPHQLRELCVMAGLDPASEATRQLVELLLARRNEKSGRIHFDLFMQVGQRRRPVQSMHSGEQSLGFGPFAGMDIKI